MRVCTVYAMFALYSYCGQKLLYADFANKIYHISYKHQNAQVGYTACFAKGTNLNAIYSHKKSLREYKSGCYC